MAHIFLSHSDKDHVFIEQLRKSLESKGLEVWDDNTHMRTGEGLYPTIKKAIEYACAFIVVLSKHTADSHWVKKEVCYALTVRKTRRKEGAAFVYPIILLLTEGVSIDDFKLYLQQEMVGIRIESGLSDIIEPMSSIKEALCIRSTDTYHTIILLDRAEENTPKLRCDISELSDWAKRYSYDSDINLTDFKEVIKARKYMTKAELLTVGLWKSPRSARNILKNAKKYVEEMTKKAFATKSERDRIRYLKQLDGVGLPIASVILHFFTDDRYPIIDYRALWSVSLDSPPPYSFKLWWQYVEFCRALSTESGLNMRELDKALWQYSRVNQPPSNQINKGKKGPGAPSSKTL